MEKRGNSDKGVGDRSILDLCSVTVVTEVMYLVFLIKDSFCVITLMSEQRQGDLTCSYCTDVHIHRHCEQLVDN